LIIALAVRIVIVGITHHSFYLITDEQDYSRIAASLASGHGFGDSVLPYTHGPSAFRPPLYPAVLALTYLFTGVSRTFGRLENAVIGTVAVLMIGFLGRQLFDRTTALGAMGLAAIFPPLLLASYGLGYEALLIALICASLACALRARSSEHPTAWLLGAALLCGLGILTQDTAFALLPFLMILAWRSGLVTREKLKRSVGVLAVALLVAAPWTIRNAIEIHAFVPVTTAIGVQLEGTYNPTAPTAPGGPALWTAPWSVPSTLAILKSTNETDVQLEHQLLTLSSQYLETHPTYVGTVVFWNTVRLFDLRGPSDALRIAPWIPYPRPLVLISVYSGYPIDALAIAGLFTRRLRRIPRSFWITPILFYLGLVAVDGNIRYRAILEPFLILLAGVALVEGFEWVRGDTRHRSLVSATQP
jgi:4-amino-4-deoxy-L-arabinose transferase-like glycosyltransferase